MNSLKTTTCLVTQSCLTLATLWTIVCQASLVHGDSPGKNSGVGCHAFLQGISPTQGSNPGFLHCRWILNCLSHQESPVWKSVTVNKLFALDINVETLSPFEHFFVYEFIGLLSVLPGPFHTHMRGLHIGCLGCGATVNSDVFWNKWDYSF